MELLAHPFSPDSAHIFAQSELGKWRWKAKARSCSELSGAEQSNQNTSHECTVAPVRRRFDRLDPPVEIAPHPRPMGSERLSFLAAVRLDGPESHCFRANYHRRHCHVALPRAPFPRY